MIRFGTVYEQLLDRHGPQQWWPARDRFEVMVGALLVQRTAWSNVESAIDRLRQQELLDADALHCAPTEQIEACIRSAGFYRTKARRLKALAYFVALENGIEALERKTTPDLRRVLLELAGIGEETADAILLYAFDRPVAVVDEYLRRFARRYTAAEQRIPDSELRAWVQAGLGEDIGRLNELHALVVAHGKKSCLKVPRCEGCAIRDGCATGAGRSNTELG